MWFQSSHHDSGTYVGFFHLVVSVNPPIWHYSLIAWLQGLSWFTVLNLVKRRLLCWNWSHKILLSPVNCSQLKLGVHWFIQIARILLLLSQSEESYILNRITPGHIYHHKIATTLGYYKNQRGCPIKQSSSFH